MLVYSEDRMFECVNINDNDNNKILASIKIKKNGLYKKEVAIQNNLKEKKREKYFYISVV